MHRHSLSQMQALLPSGIALKREGLYLHFVNAAGHVYFMVQVDDVFDAHGNRFEDDI